MKEERMTSSVLCTPHDEYHDTINLMHSAQGYRMIGVEWLSEQHPIDGWWTFHHLIVEVLHKKLVHYSFLIGRNSSNYLYNIEVEDDLSFEDALLKYTKDVCRDGQATLHVIPM